jgi:pyrimidine oxygenase
MIKLRGFGGKTEFWEYGLESFTLMAGLAAVTETDQDLRDLPDPDHPAGLRRADVQHDRFDQPWPLRIEPDHRLAEAGIFPDGPVARRGSLPQPLQMLDEYADPARAVGDRGLGLKGDYYRWTIAGSGRSRPAT